MPILRRLLSPFREFGALAGMLYLGDRALSSMSPRLRIYAYELIVQPIPDQPLLASRRSSSIEVREIEDGDPALAAMPVSEAVISDRWRQQATCLGAFKKGELIGYMWFSPRQYEEDEVRCTYVLEPPAQSVFDYDFFILPDHRMGRGFASLWDGANEHLRARAVRQTFSRVSRFNLASRRAHAHLGGTRLGRAAFLVLGPFQLTVASVPPYLHFGSGADSRVRLTLRAEVPGQ